MCTGCFTVLLKGEGSVVIKPLFLMKVLSQTQYSLIYVILYPFLENFAYDFDFVIINPLMRIAKDNLNYTTTH